MAFNIGILISGNGSNMLNIIRASKSSEINSKIVTVVSNNSDALGIKKAKRHNINTKIINHKLYSKNDFEKNLFDHLKKKSVNLICLAGFMKVLSADFIKRCNFKIINIHPSLLPSLKGLDTHKRAINMNVKYSGCTIHYVNKDIDSGPIIDQEIVRITKNDDEQSLKKKILMKEHKLYIKVLKNLEKNCE